MTQPVKGRTPEAVKPPGRGSISMSGGAPIAGIACLGRRTKELVARLPPGAIAVLDHADLDAVAARALIPRRPAAIVNNQATVTGRYFHLGPQALLDAGIPIFDIVDGCGDAENPPLDLFARLTDGERVTIRENALLRADGTVVIARLEPLTPDRLRERAEAGRQNLDAELSAFAENTLQFLHRPEERDLLLGAIPLPPILTPLQGRPVLVVVRGEDYEEDLRRLGRYVREQRPAVIAVDGAADTLLASGIRPDIILGDMDSVGDAALRAGAEAGAEIVVHAYARTRASEVEETGETRETNAAPGLARVRALGLDAHVFPVSGTSEDAALLLAYEKGADLIVAVGTHTNLEDFLGKGRRGMASTFLVRLKVGSRLVDARGVSRLYRRRDHAGPQLLLLLLSACFPVAILLWQTPQGQVAWRSIVLWFRLLVR